jgi:type VI protein secretion system component VasK
MLAPFVTEEGRRWQKRTGPFNVPKLPPDMLTKINAVAKISSVLWDKEGKERPFEFMIKAGPLPSALPNEPLPALSFLNVGDVSVFGYNQKPSWKKLKYQWQNQYWAAVGIEFAPRDKSPRVKKTIEVPTSYWSFFRLLKKSKEYAEISKYAEAGNGVKPARNISVTGNGKKGEESQTVRWAISFPATNIEGRSVDIIFTIQGNPWDVFNLPR